MNIKKFSALTILLCGIALSSLANAGNVQNQDETFRNLDPYKDSVVVGSTSGPIKIEDLNLKWIKSTDTTGYYYDEKTLKVDKAKRTIKVDACIWYAKDGFFATIGGWTFDYNKQFNQPSWYKETRISDGATIKHLDTSKGKFRKVPFNADRDNKIFEDYFFQFVK